jgi:RNA polymerase sigma-70 factor (ECF subfamily)
MSANNRTELRTPLDDEKIIELYWERNEQAIGETDFKYKNYLFVIAYNILNDKLDCEECLNDTYLGAWNSIPPSRPYALKAFLTVIMRRAAIKRYHTKSRTRVIPSELTVSFSEIEAFVSGEEDIEADFDAEKLGQTISGFIRSLAPRRQFIFMSRYYTADSIDVIAKNLNLSRSMVNKELAAIRNALKETLEKEGYSV